LVPYDAFIWKGLRKGAALSAEENKAVVRRMIEGVWNDHDFTNFEEVVAENHFDQMAAPEYQRGVAGERHVIEWLLTVFPDHRFDIEYAAGDGETVAVRGTCRGTHEGEFWDIPPTGKRFAVQQSHWFRVVDGKVAKHWAGREVFRKIAQWSRESSIKVWEDEIDTFTGKYGSFSV
jgi:predicted ester cyclase